MSLRVLRQRDYRRTPWKNGGGTTREVALSPPGTGWSDFHWRMSFAEVTASGPFSVFPGVDRVIVLVQGQAMTLTVDGVRHQLERHRPYAFRGESETSCEVQSATLDFNVMTRRDQVRAEVEVVEAHGGGRLEPASGQLAVVALAGRVGVSAADGDTVDLELADAVVVTGAPSLVLDGSGTLAVVRLSTGRRGGRVGPVAPGGRLD